MQFEAVIEEVEKPKASAKPQCRRVPRWSKWLAALVLLLVLASMGWEFRAPLLTGLARWWVVSDPITKSDAVVVLGGGLPQRALEAARLYHAGLASRVVYTDVPTSRQAQEGLFPPEAVLTRTLLLKYGVPESALVCVGKSVASTYEEATAVREWAQQSQTRSIIVPTDEFHARRVRSIFLKILKPVGAVVQVGTVVNADARSKDWWQTDTGVVTFQNEVLKYFYYQLKY